MKRRVELEVQKELKGVGEAIPIKGLFGREMFGGIKGIRNYYDIN